jgi:hypothetical protein
MVAEVVSAASAADDLSSIVSGINYADERLPPLHETLPKHRKRTLCAPKGLFPVGYFFCIR